MKHLVKKYVRLSELTEDAAELAKNAPVDESELAKIGEKKMDGYLALALTEDNKLVQTFKYEENNSVYLIPEPDPIVIYFDTARHFYRTIQSKRDELFSKLLTDQVSQVNFTAVNGDFYWYFSNVSACLIFLFLSIEAFVNKSIPIDFEYKKKIQDKRTEVYDKLQIQRNIDFLEKIKYVMPEVRGENFVQRYSHKFEQIRKLKKFRDEIVHTKSFEGIGTSNFYQDLYIMSFDFEFEMTLFSVRDFINFYQPNLIVECNCGMDE